MSPADFVLVTVLVAGASCIQGAAGFGMGLLAAPILTLIDADFVPAPVIIAVVPLTLLVAFRDWAHLDRRGLGWAILGRLPGALAGAAAVAALSHHALALFVGASVLAAVAVSLMTPRFRPTRSALVSAGFASGFMGTTTSIGGPPMALVYQSSDGPTFRSTLATYFAVGAAISLATLAAAGQLGRQSCASACCCGRAWRWASCSRSPSRVCSTRDAPGRWCCRSRRSRRWCCWARSCCDRPDGRRALEAQGRAGCAGGAGVAGAAGRSGRG